MKERDGKKKNTFLIKPDFFTAVKFLNLPADKTNI